MFTEKSVGQHVREFIVENFLFNQERTFTDDDSFLGEGIVDSTGVLQLVTFLEETYGITVEDEDLTPENMDSVNSVAAFLSRKMNSVAGSVPLDQKTVPGGQL
ncbi:MAG: acyl carrier protein [Acidobacteriia bacterium]|nr:acyl carrier protein [Terriglobia bacterium]